MAYAEARVNGFTLDLRDDPFEVGLNGAVNARDVEFDRPGRVRSRDGLSQADSSGTGHTPYHAIFPTFQGPVAAYTSLASVFIDWLNFSGAIADLGVNLAGNGTPKLTGLASMSTLATTRTVFYLATSQIDAQGHNVTPVNLLTKFTPGAGDATTNSFTGGATVNAPGSPAYLTVWQNRLVQCGYAGNASPSTGNGLPANPGVTVSPQDIVFFSDPGNGDSYPVNNWVELQPGDGEPIIGAVTWREFAFIAKRTSLFVFYGTDTDATGGPIFRYRRVSIPARAFRITAGDDGVYILTQRGIYRTTGGTPVLVSDPVTPLFDGSTSIGTITFDSSLPFAFAGGRLYTGVLLSAAQLTVVFDPLHETWTLHSYFAGGRTYMASTTTATGSDGTYMVTAANPHFYVADRAVSTDAGSAYTATYTSGYGDLGNSDVKVVREALVTGSGTVSHQATGDAGNSYSSATSLAFTAGAPTQRDRTAFRGRELGFKLTGTGAWTVDSIAYHLRGQRAPGIG